MMTFPKGFMNKVKVVKQSKLPYIIKNLKKVLGHLCILYKLQDNIQEVYLNSLTQVWFLGDLYTTFVAHLTFPSRQIHVQN